ncbi:MAG: ASKHA domain-containing protein [Acidimicrobiia bacterium]
MFRPSARRGEVSRGTSVLDAARTLGVDIDSVCGGRGLCGRCQVELGAAPGIDSARALTAPGAVETQYRGRRPLVGQRRLACAARVMGDAVIDVPAASRVHRQVARKRPEVTSINVDPVVRLLYVVVDEPTMEDPASDLRRLLRAVEQQWGRTDLRLDSVLFPSLQRTLREGKWSITVAACEDGRIAAMWPGFHDVALGVAFDVGSTTLAGHLCDLQSGEILGTTGAMNPQIRFGEDLMSRVSYTMMHPGGDAEMTTAVREALDEMIGELAVETGHSRHDILEVALVGNPIMHHLVLGIDPSQLGVAPFTLATEGAVITTAAALELEANPGAGAYLLPCVAGHVGADAAGAILSEGPHREDGVQLLVDIGTNAEIVLGGRGRLLAASSPTGPAFEGAQISSGQRAAPGAIERVRVDPATLEPRFRVVGCDLWSDHPEFSDAVAATGVTGICGSGIIEAIAELFLAGVIDTGGRFSGDHSSDRLVRADRTWSYTLVEGEPPISILQVDVRAIQLAKAALYAGTKLLMERLGVDRVDEIRLAGAFGSHIDPTYAMVLGLVPDCEPERVSAAGNAAGTGAMMALLSAESRREIESVVRSIEKVETAVEPSFQEHFVAAMGLPHTSDAFPHLAERVDLPQAGAPDDRPRTRRRRST